MISRLSAVFGALLALYLFSDWARGQSPVQWRIDQGGNGHWYKRNPSQLNRDSARQVANAAGGELASVSSAAENSFVLGIAQQQSAWLGGDQPYGSAEPAAGWRWLDGSPWSFTNWGGSEPNDGGGGPTGEQAVQLLNDGTWNDYWPDRQLSSVIEWYADCNDDGVVDYGQIIAGQLPDANSNGVPDCCEQGGCDPDGDGIQSPSDNCPTTPNPDQLDCNGNGIGDVCETFADCNTNSIPDSCDIASGFSPDLDANGVPDTCQPDCNLNGLPDAWEITTGVVSDLNIDGTPDDCQGAAMVRLESENLGAPSGAVIRAWEFVTLLPAETEVTITVDLRGDLNGQTEWVDIVMNDGPPIRAFEAGGNDCPETPDRVTISLTREEYNALIGAERALEVRIECPASVDATECKGSGLTVVSLAYVGITTAGDCNGNDRLDLAETYEGLTPDCNDNLRPDSCDIASGTAQDCNTNGVPDSCELVEAPALDCNANGIIDSCDLATGGTAVDCDLNGRIDSCQVTEEPDTDCNGNLRPDACDVATGSSPDRDGNLQPDECQTVSVPGDYATIQQAIETAPPKVMRIVAVSPGTYAGPLAFNGKPVVVRGTGEPDDTIISGSSGQQHSVVRFTGGEPPIAALENLTVRGGETGSPLPSAPQFLVGGGILSVNSAASVRDCIVELNASTFGGGAYFWNSTGSIERCIIRNNTAVSEGGGVQLRGGSPDLVDCVVEANSSNSRGGGLAIQDGTPTLLRTIVRENLSGNLVGGISWVPVTPASAFLRIDDCEVIDNDAVVAQGGIGVIDPSNSVTFSMFSTQVCGNMPRPNMTGRFQDLGGNAVCDCVPDLVLDGTVNGADLALFLSAWGPCSGNCAADFDRDGVVNATDLATLLSAWGPCGG